MHRGGYKLNATNTSPCFKSLIVVRLRSRGGWHSRQQTFILSKYATQTFLDRNRHSTLAREFQKDIAHWFSLKLESRDETRVRRERKYEEDVVTGGGEIEGGHARHNGDSVVAPIFSIGVSEGTGVPSTVPTLPL